MQNKKRNSVQVSGGEGRASSFKPSLGALTAAAMALPGIGAAQPLEDGVQTEYLYSHYREADIPGHRTVDGHASERYRIDTHSFRVLAPIGERVLAADLVYETLSGASPWFVLPDADGRPVQVMSRPTIDETRLDLTLSGRTPVAQHLSLTLSGGWSDENDYRALYGGAELEYNPGGGAWTWNLGLGGSSDSIEPVQSSFHPPSVDKEDKRSLRAHVGASFILNRSTLLQGSVGVQDHSGFLSDPYKRAWIINQADAVPDARPDGRRSWHTLARLRHFVERWQGALHADYRYFHDDWEIRSHTVELTWHQTLPDYWRVSPGLRWYSQSQAFFYAPFFDDRPMHGFVSSDYRLSPFGALAYRLDVTKGWNNWAFGFGVEHYEASGRYAASSVGIESPGLVRYTTFSARVAASF